MRILILNLEQKIVREKAAGSTIQKIFDKDLSDKHEKADDTLSKPVIFCFTDMELRWQK